MPEKTEYATTLSMAEPFTGYAEPPFSPPGDGWVLKGIAVAPSGVDGRFHLFAAWEREVSQ